MARPVQLRIERVSACTNCNSTNTHTNSQASSSSSNPTTPEVAANLNNSRGLHFRCRSSVGALVLHVGLFLFLGALLCSALMLLRSTKLLATFSNHTLLTSAGIRVPRSVHDESCAKESKPANNHFHLHPVVNMADSKLETPYSVTYVSIDDREKGMKLAKSLVENNLAACVQIIPKITSIYRWEGKVNEEDELLLVIKSRKSRLQALTEFVVANHPYQVAEVVSLPIQHGNPSYLEWLGKEVPEG